tara:strand:+ start:424 stop:768 length:345 start_codon:yes stop_codon:yes gene_type:complete
MVANYLIAGNGASGSAICDNASIYNGATAFFTIPFPVSMRTKPSLFATASSTFGYYKAQGGLTAFASGPSLDGVTTTTIGNCSFGGSFDGNIGQSILVRTKDNQTGQLAFQAEL